MHFFTGVSRNTQSESYKLSLTEQGVRIKLSEPGDPKIMHYVILLSMSYLNKPKKTKSCR